MASDDDSVSSMPELVDQEPEIDYSSSDSDNSDYNLIASKRKLAVACSHVSCMLDMSQVQKDDNINLRKVVLLDNQSMADIFCNKHYVINICKSKKTMLLIRNSGELKISTVADLDGYGMVWFDFRAITNILSLARVRQMCMVVHDCK